MNKVLIYFLHSGILLENNYKAKQNSENPRLEELDSENCISEDQVVMEGVNSISYL